MRDLRVSRRKILTAGAVGALGALLDPAAVLAKESEEVELLRWDLVRIVQGTVLDGGSVMGKDDGPTGDTVTLTGSGEARPERRTAAGGGTFVHKHANGSEVAHGVYVVTGFNSFIDGHGTLPASLTDGIGHAKQADSGKLSLKVKAHAAGIAASIDATLTVECGLPGDTSGAVEGIKLDVPALNLHFHQVPEGGVTVFHILQRD
jgi:hypothetical protein